jgi:hypothetical protein
MFSRLIVTNITSAQGAVHCRKTRIPCGDQLVVCGQYYCCDAVNQSLRAVSSGSIVHLPDDTGVNVEQRL